MPGDMRPHVHVSTHMHHSQHGEKSPVSKSLSTVQSHMPNRNFVVATATLVTVSFYFHSSHSSCFTLNETFGMLQQQALYWDRQMLDRT